MTSSVGNPPGASVHPKLSVREIEKKRQLYPFFEDISYIDIQIKQRNQGSDVEATRELVQAYEDAEPAHKRKGIGSLAETPLKKAKPCLNGSALPDLAESDNPGALSDTKLLARYPQFSAKLDVRDVVKAQRRSLSWLLSCIEAIFDSVQDEMGSNDVAFSFPTLAFSSICVSLGRTQACRSAWDLLVTLEHFIDGSKGEELKTMQIIPLFGRMLRGTVNSDAAFLYCSLRHEASKMLKFKLQSPPGKVSRALNDLGVEVKSHRILPNTVHVRQIFCKALLRRFFGRLSPDSAEENSSFVLEQVLSFEPGMRVSLAEVLSRVLENYLDVPDDIVLKVKYKDDGNRTHMLQRLKRTLEDNVERQKLEQELHMQKLAVEIQKAKVHALIRKKPASIYRTELLLAKSESLKLEQRCSLTAQALELVRQRVERTWTDVLTGSQPDSRNEKPLPVALMLYVSWLDRQRKGLALKRKTAKKLRTLNWKRELEGLQTRSAIILQRSFRKRKRQRLEAAEASKELDERKQQAKVRRQAEERLLKQQQAALEKHKKRLQSKKNEEEKVQRDMKAREDAILNKHRRREAERRALRYERKLTGRAFSSWRAEVRLLQLKRKRDLLRRKEAFQGWVDFLFSSRVLKAARKDAATKIQSAVRRAIAHEHVQEKKRLQAATEQRVVTWMARILRKREHMVFEAWIDFTNRSITAKQMCRRALDSLKTRAFRSWTTYVEACRDRKAESAWIIQGWTRGLRHKKLYELERRRRNCAKRIQRWWRWQMLCDRVAWEKHMLQRYSKKIRFRVTYEVFQKWKDKTAVAKQCKRLFASSRERSLEELFSRWVEWKTMRQLEKYKAATSIQASVRQRQARKRYVYEIDGSRASKKIQAVVRGKLTRKRVMELYWDTQATLKVQRLWRVHSAWKKYQIRYVSWLFDNACYGAWTRAFDRGLAHSCKDPTTGNGFLHRAAEKGSKRLLKLCLRRGMDINMTNDAGQTCLFSLLKTSFLGQVELMDYLLCKGAEVKTRDRGGRNLLMAAAESGNDEVTSYLCGLGLLDIEAKDDTFGVTALHMACLEEKKEVVETLLKAGADILCRDRQGVMPLHDLASNGQIRMLREILPKYKDLDHGDAKGNTALHFAVAANQPEAVTMLLDEGIAADLKNNLGRSALWYAAKVGDHDMLKLLTQYDADIEGPCEQSGDAPLHCACASGNIACVKALLEEGASTSVQNKDGEVAGHVAVKVGDLEMLQLLIDYDCEVNIRNYDGHTPLGEARLRNRGDIVNIFIGNYIERTPEEMRRIREERRAKTVLAKLAKYSAFRQAALVEPTSDSSGQDAEFNENASQKETDDELMKEMAPAAWEQLLISSHLELELGTLIDSPWQLYSSQELSKEFWYNRRDHVFSWNPPEIMRDLAWSAERWEARWNERVGSMEFYDEKTKQVRSDKGAGGGKVLEKRKIQLEKKGEAWVEKPVQLDGTMNAEEYRQYWEKENKEIRDKLYREKCAVLIQTVYRRHFAALQAIAAMQRNDMATRIQAQWRRLQATRKVRRLELLSRHAIKMQSLWRRKMAKRWFLEKSKELRQAKKEFKASQILNRTCRGYNARKAYRRAYAKEIFPKPRRREDWHKLRASSTYIRSFGAWDEYRYKWPDVYLYSNRFVEKFCWEKPSSWVAHEKEEYAQVLEIQELGFTKKAYNYATLLQSIFRGNRMRKHFAKLSRGIKIMSRAEAAYLEEPFVESLAHGNTKMVVNLCNYMLYLHVVEDKIDKARPLYTMAMQFMHTRGPDNAFILYSYACFVASQCEDEFEDIMSYVYRAREADPTGQSYELAEAGYFRLRSSREPTNGIAQFNYALCLQFFGTCATSKPQIEPDYDLAEHYYLRALQYSPYNKNIVDNFNFMLRSLKGAEYDAFDAFQIHQQKLLAVQNQPQPEVYRSEDAATDIQRLVRGWLVRRHEGVIYRQCTTDDGDTFYYNPRTDESVWKLPEGAHSIIDSAVDEGEYEYKT